MNNGQAFSDATGLLNEVNNNILGLGAITASQANKPINLEVNVTKDGITAMVQEGSSEFNSDNNKIELESAI